MKNYLWLFIFFAFLGGFILGELLNDYTAIWPDNKKLDDLAEVLKEDHSKRLQLIVVTEKHNYAIQAGA